VADEQERAAGITQLAYDAEQLRAFALRQRRGRLIEDQQSRFVRERARDLHHVFLRDAQGTGRRIGTKIRIEVAQHGRGRCAQGAPIDQPTPRRLRIHEQVFRHREVVERQAFLVDHPDTERARGLRIADAHRVTADMDFTGVRLIHTRQYFHERRLAGAVLADERSHRAARQFEARALECADTAE
jgi:hypothetical protein